VDRNVASRINKLSVLAVRGLEKRGLYGDGGGLWLRIAVGGSKSWVFRYDLAGQRHEMGLGPIQTVDLSLARTKARECRLLLLDGKDPLSERRRERTAYMVERARRITFDQCAQTYIAAHRGSWRSAKHAKQWETTLSTYANPVIGALPVAAVGGQGAPRTIVDRRNGPSGVHTALWRVYFRGPGKDVSQSDMSLTAVLRRMERDDITVHGFRSTFRDWCSEAEGNNFSREVCEHALAHRLPDKVEAAYRRGDLLEKRIALIQAWSDYCHQKIA